MPVEIAKWRTVCAICHQTYGDEYTDEEAAEQRDEEADGCCNECAPA